MIIIINSMCNQKFNAQRKCKKKEIGRALHITHTVSAKLMLILKDLVLHPSSLLGDFSFIRL